MFNNFFSIGNRGIQGFRGPKGYRGFPGKLGTVRYIHIEFDVGSNSERQDIPIAVKERTTFCLLNFSYYN